MNTHSDRFLSLFTVDQATGAGRPSLVGNGELVTAFGPTGYHTSDPIPPMQVFCLAGRRLSGPTAPLVRFGQLRRMVTIDGEPSEAVSWKQTLNPLQGVLSSSLTHSRLLEETTSFVCLSANAAAFGTKVTNSGSSCLEGELRLQYRFGDWDGNIPETCQLNIAPASPGLHGRVLGFEIEGRHLGAADLTCDREVACEDAPSGFDLIWPFTLSPGESSSVAFVWGIGDKRHFRYRHLPWSFDGLLNRQIQAWEEFHLRSHLEVGDERLEAMRAMCLYVLRSNSTPWSIPPAMSPSQWEGRTFHDELYPFLGLISSGSADLAEKIPQYRLGTLPKAVERSAFRGAKFAWESTEDGGDGSPYGAWLEEHFHMGQIAEGAWQLCLYEGGTAALERFFPLFREIARYWSLNMLERAEGRTTVRPATDYDEAIFPVANGLYTACAAVRSLEIAAVAAQTLGLCADEAAGWEQTARELRSALPQTADGQRYQTCEGAMHRHVAEVGPIFPFRIDQASEMARRTLDSFCVAVRTQQGLQPGNLPNYGGSRWLWTCAHAAAAYALTAQSDRALELLREAPDATDAGLVPCEHISLDGHVALPFFTTSAGAYVFALNSLFVQVTDGQVTRIAGCPEGAPEAEFRGLAGAAQTRVSGRFRSGRIVTLEVTAPSVRLARFELDIRILPPDIRNWACIAAAKEQNGWLCVDLRLEQGVNVWRQSADCS